MPIDYFTSAFMTMLVIINPIGLAPIYAAMTADMTAEQRRSIAIRACLIAAGVLIFFSIFGRKLLELIGIGIPAFRIAGGLLLFSIAFEMLFDTRSRRQHGTAQEARTTDQFQALAAFPLAIPLMAGPGAITAAILLASRARGDWLQFGGLMVVIATVTLACFAVLILASNVARWLGTTGTVVLTRLLGVLLAAMAVQFIVDGVMSLR